MKDINSRRSIVAIVYVAVIGPCVFILQPGFVQGLVAYMGFTEQQAGLIASYEMFGVAATTVVMSFFSARVHWRKMLYGCLVLCAIGNLASIGRDDFDTLSLLRFITGLGSGGLVSLTFKMAGLTKQSDRNFGLIVMGVLAYGGFGLLLMPTAYNSVGFAGVLVFFALFCASGLYFVRDLPGHGGRVPVDEDQVEFAHGLKVVSLAALLAYNIGIGVVWAYLFLVGLDANMGEQEVANALTVSQFLGLAGAFLPVLLEVRIGRLLPLGVGIFGSAAGIYLLIGDIDGAIFWTGVCVFNFLWNLSVPYLLATMADFGHHGRMVVHGVTMQFAGFAIGPFVAAQLLEIGGFDLVNSTGVALFVLAAVLLLPGAIAQRNALHV